MWREYNREFHDDHAKDNRSEHDIILDELGETADDKWGDSVGFMP